MKSLNVFLVIGTSLCLSPAAWGQRILSSAEVQTIIQEVTSRPRKTWIPVGTILAQHYEEGAPKTTNATVIQAEINKALVEYRSNPNKKEKTAQLQKMAEDAIPFNVRYRLANRYTMQSAVEVRYDGNRFYWKIDVSARSDSVPVDAALQGNYMTRQFNRSWNDRRIFAWDGQKYTTYSASANRATVDAAGRLPRAVNGPLTAGLISWGYDRFTAASLAAAQISARENPGGLIDMTLTFTDGFSANLTLDATKAYAVTKAVIAGGGLTVTHTCTNYQSFGGHWVPMRITTERQISDFRNVLPTLEVWTLTSVSTAVPGGGSFTVPLAANAVMEYLSPLSAAPAIYVQSNTVDTDELLARRLTYAAAEGAGAQNCATAALQSVASDFGKSLSAGALARLVGPQGRTSLYDLKQFAQSQGLYCKAVQTDLAALANLQGARALLHIPGTNHLVIFDQADDRYVWLTDLSNRRFHYRQSVDFFPTEWSEGTALLLSNRPIPGSFAEIANAKLKDTLGGAGWACTMLLQEFSIWYCYDKAGGCDGSVDIYWERWGCDSAPSGTCYNECMISGQGSTCIYPGYCTITGEWTYYYMEACG